MQKVTCVISVYELMRHVPALAPRRTCMCGVTACRRVRYVVHRREPYSKSMSLLRLNIKQAAVVCNSFVYTHALVLTLSGCHTHLIIIIIYAQSKDSHSILLLYVC